MGRTGIHVDPMESRLGLDRVISGCQSSTMASLSKDVRLLRVFCSWDKERWFKWTRF